VLRHINVNGAEARDLSAPATARSPRGESPMNIDVLPFRVERGARVQLDRWPTKVRPFYESKADYRDAIDDHVERLSALQDQLYAFDRYAVLLIFQAMDAAGKDGAIKHVMSGVNPQGCEVFSFKQPSAQELQHDFLWRTTRCLPERGRIGIFNRSYYEEVLIVRVHPEILRARRIPDELRDPRQIWRRRYDSIRDLEKHLHRNGTQIIKFFLHLSRDEQRRRFLKRIGDPAKNWKFSAADLKERTRWNAYMRAYEECLSATSTRHAPWYVVPADDKKNARLIVSQVVVDTLAGLRMRYPRPSPEQRKALPSIRRALAR
jgi:PPK2 family polyphosphate:nucleotide phosphotransferase